MRFCWAMALVMGMASAAQAESQKTPPDYKKMYQDATSQLRLAQNRKAELAAENADLQRQLKAAQGQLEDLQGQASDFSQRTFMLHAFYSAWERFIGQNSDVAERWRVFWSRSLPADPDDVPLLYDPLWSLRG